MSESYPRKNPWPFVMTGLLLFCVVLWPPSDWPKAVRHVYVDWIANSVVKTAAARKLANTTSQADDGKKKRIPRVAIGSKPRPPRLPSEKGPLPKISSVDPIVQKVPSAPTPASLYVDIEQEFSSVPRQASNPAGSRAYVWQPPKDWQPTLIEPFPNTSCLLYTSPSPRDKRQSRMPSSA